MIKINNFIFNNLFNGLYYMSQINIKYVIIILIVLFIILLYINNQSEHFTLTINKDTIMSSVYNLRHKIDTVFDEPPRVIIVGQPQPTSRSLLSTITDFFGPVMTNGPNMTDGPITSYPTNTPNFLTNEPNQYEGMTNIITDHNDGHNELTYCSKNDTSQCKIKTVLENQINDISNFNNFNTPKSTLCPKPPEEHKNDDEYDILEYYKKNQVIVKSYLDDDLMLGSNIDDYENVSSLNDHGALHPEIKEFNYPKPNGYIFNNSSLKI